MHEAQITTASEVARFIQAGRANFTIRSARTGMRFTFRVDRARGDEDSPLRFIKVLSGPDNETSYQYIGFLNVRRPGQVFPGRKGHPDAPSYRALAWVLKHIFQDSMPEDLEIFHAGKCGRCGRKLTVPESIQSGLGPHCAGLE